MENVLKPITNSRGKPWHENDNAFQGLQSEQLICGNFT